MKISTVLLSLLLVTAIAVQTVPANAQTCPGNLVKNGGFRINTVITGDGSIGGTNGSHTDAWTAAYTPPSSPQLQGGAGCHDPNYISFWGNQAVGEAIQQPLTLHAGKHYSIEFCARFHPDPAKTPTFVNIVLRASNGPLHDPTCPAATCETMLTTPNITSTSWAPFRGCFTPLRDETMLTISPSNGSNANNGTLTSFGQVDDICIVEAQPPVIDGPSAACTSPSTYCVNPPAAGPFNWSVTSGAPFTPINPDGSCIAVNWPSTNGGTIHVTSNINGCPFTSTLLVRDCPHCSACTVAWNPTLDSFEDPGTLNISMNAGTQQATLVRATVLGAWHTGCGPTGPVTATANSAQPPTSGWTVSVPIVHGNQIVWSSAGQPLGTFSMNLDLSPGTGSTSCNDTVTVVVEFEVTFGALGIVPCPTCTLIRTFTFGRCPLCA